MVPVTFRDDTHDDIYLPEGGSQLAWVKWKICCSSNYLRRQSSN